MSSTADLGLGAPVRISPLIKFSRWSALLLGIAYGAKRHSYLQNRADRWKPEREARKEKRLKFENDEKKRRETAEYKNLNEVLGTNAFPVD